MVKRGYSVFTIYKSDARKIAQAASRSLYGVDGYLGPQIHDGKTGFYYEHYHVYKHKNKAHIWFLFK